MATTRSAVVLASHAMRLQAADNDRHQSVHVCSHVIQKPPALQLFPWTEGTVLYRAGLNIGPSLSSITKTAQRFIHSSHRQQQQQFRSCIQDGPAFL